MNLLQMILLRMKLLLSLKLCLRRRMLSLISKVLLPS